MRRLWRLLFRRPRPRAVRVVVVEGAADQIRALVASGVRVELRRKGR